MAKRKMLNDPIGIMDPNQFAFAEAIERLINSLDYTITYKDEDHRMTVRRLKSRPYNTLGARTSCSVIMNRGAHWNPHFNSFFLMVAPTVYLINDMVSFRSIDKNCSYGQMFELGLHIPRTYAIPQKDNSEYTDDPKVNADLIFPYHELFDLGQVGEIIGYPAFLKPQDGGGWVGVERVKDFAELQAAYDKSGKKPMNLQQAIDFKEFVRTVGVGPTMMPMHYNPDAEHSHDRYLRSDDKVVEHGFLSAEHYWEVCSITKLINSFYGWDHNSCESLVGKDDVVYPIDYANAYPDSSPVSLHYYFPDLVKAMVKWLIFCAVTKRKKRVDFAYHWGDYFAVAERRKNEEISYREALVEYNKISDAHFDSAHFEDFCDKHLPDFDERALDFFSSDTLVEVVEGEVNNYFKIPQERPEKMAHYMGILNFWAHCERERLQAVSAG